MLNGPALLRVFLVVIAAAVLTGLVQHYWMFDSGQPEGPATVARPPGPSAAARRADPVPVRSPVQPAPAQQPTPAPQPAPPPIPATQATEPTPPAPSDLQGAALPPPAPPAAPGTAPGRSLPRAAISPPPAAAEPYPGEREIAAAEAAEPRAVDLVDLNTGSLSELNGLKGGGAIGRAIIQHRPYVSADQLLSKRVLSRAIYQRIKDQITVR